MNFKGRDVISINDFSKAEILHILSVAQRFARKPTRPILRGKILAPLFFEPSTRTRLSFETAMARLGGEVVGFAEPGATSVMKGESLGDTIEMIQRYADVIVIRHPLEGSARLASERSAVPVINGGDGANQHPTQTFLDLYTLMETQPQKFNRKGKTLNVGFVGDLKYGRTVHSLAMALTRFNCRLFFISPPSLTMPRHHILDIERAGISFSEHADIEDVIQDLDILYATRIQSERFPDITEYQRVKSAYVITPQLFKHARKNCKLLHPLPRVGEVSREMDFTQYAYYFQQAANGIPVRQALLALVLGAVR